MKKWPKKIWIWILSGLGVILGSCSLFHRDNPPCLYGPPPQKDPYGFEEVYGPPVTDVDPDSIEENVEEPLEESSTETLEDLEKTEDNQ